jgi:hypothetical protein
VRNQEAGAPQVVPVSSGVAFDDLLLTVHAASADWLYQVGRGWGRGGGEVERLPQSTVGRPRAPASPLPAWAKPTRLAPTNPPPPPQALLYVFSGAVRRQIEAAMDDALRTVRARLIVCGVAGGARPAGSAASEEA